MPVGDCFYSPCAARKIFADFSIISLNLLSPHFCEIVFIACVNFSGVLWVKE